MSPTTAPPPAGPRARPRGRDSAPDAARGETRAGLRDPQLHDVVEHLGGALADAGLARLPARVFAALMATEDGRLTASEIATMLDISPAGVSGAVRYLTQVRMIRRERERGSRRDVYVVMDDAWHDMLMQSDQAYRPILEALAVARGAVEEGTRAWERMQLSVEFLEFITREMGGIAERWDEYKAARG
jgi:DNA-binding transcriptional regulator GbsR (MarR family)